MLFREISAVLFGVVSNLKSRTCVKANAFFIALVVDTTKFEVTTILNGRNDIRFSPVAMGLDQNRFLACIHMRTKFVSKDFKYIPFEIDVCVSSIAMNFFPSGLLFFGEFRLIALETVVEADDDIHVTLGKDIGVISV